MRVYFGKYNKLLKSDYLYFDAEILSDEKKLEQTLNSMLHDKNYYVFFESVKIGKNLEAVNYVLDKIKEKTTSENLNFYLFYESSEPEFNKLNLKHIQSIQDKIYENFNKPLLFPFSMYDKIENEYVWELDYSWSFQQVVKANTTLDDIANEINRQGLSPFERFLAAYSWASSFRYKSEEKEDRGYVSRNIIDVLNGDKIVCVGFAKLLDKICEKIDIPCAFTYENYPEAAHVRNLVRIDDDKYDIHGVYFSDPTFGSKKSDKANEKDYFHYLTPMNLSLSPDAKIPQGDIAYRLVKNMKIKDEHLLSILNNNIMLDGYDAYDYLCENGFFKGPYLPFKDTVSHLNKRLNKMLKIDTFKDPEVINEMIESTERSIERLKSQNLIQIKELQDSINKAKFVPLDKFASALTEVMCNLNLNYYEGEILTQKKAKKFVREIVEFTANKHSNSFNNPEIQDKTTFSDRSFFTLQKPQELPDEQNALQQ